MTAQLSRFTIADHTRGFASPLGPERVGLNFLGLSGAPSINVTMSATEARSIANALYEAADAAEKVLPVAGAKEAA